MRCLPRRLVLLVAAAATIVLTQTGAQGAILTSDLWLRSGETYVELIDAGLPDGNTLNAAAGWGFPDTSDLSVTVNGNCADNKDHTGGEMDMTVGGLVVGQTYSFDAIAFGRALGDASGYGVAAGFQSGLLAAYDMIGDYGRTAIQSVRPGSSAAGVLYRVPLGEAVADANGNVHVFFDVAGARTQIDGVVFREPTTPPVPTLIGSVVRTGGASGTQVPVGPYDGSTGPLPSSDYGLQLGSQPMSDRNLCFDVVDEPLRGADYIRTFNSDKATPDVDYEVTFNSRVFAMITIEDRAVNPQAYVDAVVDAFAAPGTFTDTGLQTSINYERTSSQIYFSVYGAWLDAGTYHFGNALWDAGEPGEGMETFYSILAMTDKPVAPRIPGDTDHDGDVDDDDAQTLATHWLQTVSGGPDDGDFNDDQIVDDRDAAILAAHWVRGSGGSESVPEPSSMTLLAILAATVGMLVSRRRNG